MRACVTCSDVKREDEFYARNTGYRNVRCKTCVTLAQRLSKFNITRAQYDAMLDAQDGRCAICHGEPSPNPRGGATLVIDHDHNCCAHNGSCGDCVRGLLCHACNRALGAFGERTETLSRALAYLGGQQ